MEVFSTSDCKKIISKKSNSEHFTIITFHQKVFDQMNGYLGEHSSLVITIRRNDAEEKHHFFVKSLPKVESQRNFILEINGFFKEKQFFGKYLPLLKNHSIDILDEVIPTCFLVKEDNFVFEDLGMQGYTTFMSREPLKLVYVKSALATLAKLHASGLILEEISSSRLLDDFETELAETFYSDNVSVKKALNSSKHGIDALIDLTHDKSMKISEKLFKAKSHEGVDLQKIFTKPSEIFRNTICHSDPWTKNFMFKMENGGPKCVLVDFQTYRYGPPGQDVMAFLHLTTERRFRDQNLQQLLRFYFGELGNNLVEFGFGGLVTEEEFFESCRYFKQFALTQAITHFQIIIMSDEIGDELMSNPENARSVMFENKYDFIVTNFQKDDVFRKMNLEALEELREFYEIKC